VYVRGSSAGVEYKRQDNNFYKGTVVQNNDPEELLRVKVYIPELSNEPLDDWLNSDEYKATKFPGTNNKTDNFSDTSIFHVIQDLIPWAEPCLPLMGEHGPGRFFSKINNGIGIISDTNYPEEAVKNDTKEINETEGVTGPSRAQTLQGEQMGDEFKDPSRNSAVFNNPHSFDFQPIKYTDGSKGMFGVPNVGAQVWVFHYQGDCNFPVYFGGRAGFGDVATIMASKQGAFGTPAISQDLPSGSENDPPYKVEDVPPLPPEERGSGEVLERQQGKIRSRPIQPRLKNILSKAAAAADVTVTVTSGGQPSTGSRRVRTGSHRHDNGWAADFIITDNKTGKKVPISNQTKWAQFTKAFKQAASSGGYKTSGGAAVGYMGAYTAHFDIAAGINPGVRQAVWGTKGRRDYPSWVTILN
tara:strand:- start:3607 stop:4848 length:1242 start_codon:yes stop_codon:yes gene_type:complete